MIWLPGILSQGGKKYTWNRYAIAYGEKAGTAATVTRTYNKSKYASNAYTIQNGVFVLTNPVATTFANLASGKYTVDMADSTNTISSGARLYKITSNSGLVYTDASSNFTTHSTTINGSYVIGAEKYTFDKSNGVYKISFRNIQADVSSQQWKLYGYNRYYDTIYSTNSYLTPNSDGYPTTSSKLYAFSAGTISNDGKTVTGDSYQRIAVGPDINIRYTPYTISQSKGDLIDTVTDRDPAAYPENGIQDGYWYVLQTA